MKTTEYRSLWEAREEEEKRKRVLAIEKAREVAKILKRKYKVKEVILFGSLVWRTDFLWRGTDIDLLVKGLEEWHSELLHQMTLDIKGLRPPVISPNIEKILREYLGFRHLFRKRYGFELDWQKTKRLLLKIPQVLSGLEREIEFFFKTLMPV